MSEKTEDKPTEATEPMVEVFNRGVREFQHAPHKVRAGVSTKIPLSYAKMLMKDFPGEIIANEDAVKAVEGANAELGKLRALITKQEGILASQALKIEELEETEAEEVTDLKSKLTAADAEIADLKSKLAALG